MIRLQRIHTPVHTRSIDRDNLTVDIVASTFSIDSYGTRFDQSGWVMKRFLSNPVITWAHDDRGLTPSGGLPIANAIPETVRVEDGKLQMRLRFTPEEDNPFGYRVFRLIANGFLHGLSVGFDPLEWEDVEEEVNGERRRVRIFREIELQEVAVVTIPSNSETLVKRAKEYNHDPEEVKKLAEEVETEAKARSVGQPQTVDDVLSMLDDCPAKEFIVMHRNYFERKKPANKIATRVLKRFYERVLNEEPPAEETEAWEKMDQAVEAMEPQATEEVIETAEAPAETPAETPEATTAEETPAPEAEITQSTPPVQAAPEPERTASVQIPLSVLAELPTRMVRTYVDAAVEALRRGIPVKEVDSLIDGLNGAVSQSLSTPIHGQRNPTPA